MSVIVVGVDGSEPSEEALRYALRQARLEGADIRAVTAWHVPGISYGGPGAAPLVNLREAFEADAKAISRKALDAVSEAADGLQIDAVVREDILPRSSSTTPRALTYWLLAHAASAASRSFCSAR
jgi:nucleotide-binding universal stress UspA family protein